MKINARYYPKLEEKINVITHAIGLLMSVSALTLLVVFASMKGTVWHIVSFSVYGASLVI
ncbi:MAG: hemolysin D, partial [Bacteroidetes bacterium]